MGGLLLYVRLAKAINKGGWLEVGVRGEGGGGLSMIKGGNAL